MDSVSVSQCWWTYNPNLRGVPVEISDWELVKWQMRTKMEAGAEEVPHSDTPPPRWILCYRVFLTK